MNTTQFDIYISTIYEISQLDHMQNDEIKFFSFDENQIVNNKKFIMNENIINENIINENFMNENFMNENFMNEHFINEHFMNENFMIEFYALNSSNRDFFDDFDHDRFVKVIFNNVKANFDQAHAMKIFFNKFNENETSINF